VTNRAPQQRRTSASLRSAIGENRFLYVLVFVVGTASLGAEIAAARLMAPFFGASTIIWANTIGVVLVALSVGYWLGGRLADRRPDVRSLCQVVLAAAVLLAVVPLVARPFLGFSIDALDQIKAGAFVGSLFAVLFLIAVPVVLLGTCAPWALRLAVDDVEHAGRISGRLYAISTIGSLTGTMLAALVLIPFAGTQRTFLAFSLALAVVAAIGLGWRFVVVPVAVAIAIAIPVGTVKATSDGRVLYEDESEQQYIRVIQQSDGDRVLELNEGQAVHSILPARGFLTADYWDSFLVLPFTARERQPGRIAILGNAAGTIAREYGRFWPRTEVDGVELDPQLSEVGYRYFDMGSNPRLTVHNEDARPWLRDSEGGYEMIVVDAYRQPYIPFYLATKEFFELVRDRLAPGGVVVVNVGHPEGSDEFERVLGRTMAAVFPTVLRDPAEQTNSLLLGSEAPASAARLATAARARMHGNLRDLALIDAARLAPRLPGGSVYTDDRAPVEWLIDRSILGYAESR
jgi:spermidine synthase